MTVTSEALRWSVVIPYFNERDYLPATLASLYTQDMRAFRLILVDNASTDGTRDWLKTKPVATLMTPVQWSLAKCWNEALRALWRTGHTSALLCNNDILLRPDTLRLLLDRKSTRLNSSHT